MKSFDKESISGNKMSWILISGVAFLISFLASAVLILMGDKLNTLGIAGNIYYIILIPLGFSSAAFLAGAMKSYASFKSNEKIPYGKLHLTGPIVIFVLVVGGGFIMPNINNKVTSFDLKVRIVSKDQPTHQFNEGLVKLYLGKNTYPANIHEGEALFANIPVSYHNKKAKIIPLIQKYQSANSNDIILSKNQESVEINVIRTAASVSTSVRGTLVDGENMPIKNAFINFGSGLATTKTNENGDFSLTVPLEAGEKLPLKILINGVITFDEVITISGELPLDLKLKTKF